MSKKASTNKSMTVLSGQALKNARAVGTPTKRSVARKSKAISLDHFGDTGALGLGQATKEYAQSLANPFASGPDGACIPNTPALMTRRSKVFSKGTFSTSNAAGAQGVGWIVVDPLSAFGNDRPFVTWNIPNQATNLIDITGSQAATSFATSNSDYVQANLSAQVAQARVVSCGLKIRNVTSVLQRGGFIVGLQEPAHTCINAFNIPTMDAYLEAGRISGTTDKWVTLTYRPVDTDDLDFQTQFVAPGTGVANSTYMGFIVQAPDSTGANNQLYEFEAFCNLEIQGPRVIGKMPSHADPVGYAAVNAMTVFSPVLHSPHQDEPDRVGAALIEGAQHLVDHHTSHPSSVPKPKKKDTSVWSDVLKSVPSVVSGIGSLLSWF